MMGSAWDTAAIWLLDAAAKSVLIFAAAMLLCLALRRTSAVSRHYVWVAAMAGMFCLPLLRLTLPAVRLRVLPPVVSTPIYAPTNSGIAPRHMVNSIVSIGHQPESSAAPILPPPANESVALPAKPGDPVSARSMSVIPSASHASHRVSVRTMSVMLLILWISGAVFLLMRLTVGLIGAWRLVRSCELTPHTALVEDCSRLLALAARVQVRIGTAGSRPRVPMTCWAGGIPIVLLPSTAVEWPQERLRSVIMHEMAHVKRGDWFTMLLAQAVCAVYWMNPLVWIAARLLRLEAEKATDELVLRSGVSPADYAAHLLAIARSLVPQERPVAALAMAHQSEIGQRLSAILAFRSIRSSKGNGRVFGAAVLIVAVLLAAVQLAPREQAMQSAALGAVSRMLHAQLVNTFVTDTDMNSVAFTPSGTSLITGSWNDSAAPGNSANTATRMAFLSLATGKQIRGKKLTTALVAAAYSPNGRLLATLYAGGYLHISDADTGLTQRAIQLPSSVLDTLEFSPDGLTVACAAVGDGKSRETAGRLYLVDTMTARVRGPEYRGIFRHLQQHWDGRPFAVAAKQWRVMQWDPKVTLWSPHWGKPTISLDTAADTCASRGNIVAVLSGNEVQIWGIDTRERLISFATGMKTDRMHSRLVFSPDGHSLALGAAGEIKVWHIDGIEDADQARA